MLSSAGIHGNKGNPRLHRQKYRSAFQLSQTAVTVYAALNEYGQRASLVKHASSLSDSINVISGAVNLYTAHTAEQQIFQGSVHQRLSGKGEHTPVPEHTDHRKGIHKSRMVGRNNRRTPQKQLFLLAVRAHRFQSEKKLKRQTAYSAHIHGKAPHVKNEPCTLQYFPKLHFFSSSFIASSFRRRLSFFSSRKAVNRAISSLSGSAVTASSLRSMLSPIITLARFVMPYRPSV